MKPLLIFLLLTVSVTGFAVDYHQFADPKQQQAYESLTSQLRCLVCQNQTIADSNAELAGDLRRQVYEMLQQGKSKAEILRFMTDRYGDFVLYKPPFKAKTGLLWLGPGAFLMIGLTVVFFYVKRKKIAAASLISAEKEHKIRALLENNEKGDSF